MCQVSFGRNRKFFLAPSLPVYHLCLRMPELKEGDQAPDISLETDSGEAFTLSSLHGKNVVLYFYPKADTPGCTKEACEFRDTSPRSH